MHFRLLCAFLLATVVGRTAAVDRPAGRWEGTILFGALNVPFTIVFEGSGSTIIGSFVNGSAKVSSTSGSFEAGQLRLAFKQFGGILEATLADGGLKGKWTNGKDGQHAFTAFPYCTCSYEGEAGPDIIGDWEIPELGWRIALQREGEDTLATRSAGEEKLGPLKGRFDGLTFTLHYFDGLRAAVAEIEPRKDSELDVVWREPGQTDRKARMSRAKSH